MTIPPVSGTAVALRWYCGVFSRQGFDVGDAYRALQSACESICINLQSFWTCADTLIDMAQYQFLFKSCLSGKLIKAPTTFISEPVDIAAGCSGLAFSASSVPLRRASELAGRRFPALRRVQDSTGGGSYFPPILGARARSFWCKAYANGIRLLVGNGSLFATYSP